VFTTGAVVDVVVDDGGGGFVVGVGALVVVDDAGAVVAVELVVVDDVLVEDVVVVRSALSTLPGNELGDAKSPTSIPSVIASMYRCQIVAGNVPPNTTRPCTLSITCWGSPGPLRYPIHTAVV
jgi:hypothetical protein